MRELGKSLAPKNSLKPQPKTNDCQICIKSILHVPSWMFNLHSFIIIIIRIKDAVTQIRCAINGIKT